MLEIGIGTVCWVDIVAQIRKGGKEYTMNESSSSRVSSRSPSTMSVLIQTNFESFLSDLVMYVFSLSHESWLFGSPRASTPTACVYDT